MKVLAKQISAVVLGLGIATPIYAVDSTSSPRVEVINNIRTSASTGGNSAHSTGSGQAGSGEIIQGESKASVKIYTTVDGEVVEDFEETVTGAAGEGAVIQKSVEVNAPQDSPVYTQESPVGTADEAVITHSLFAFLNKIFKYVFSIFKFS